MIALALFALAGPAAAQKPCDQFRSGTTATGSPLTEVIPGAAGKRVYLCGYVFIANAGQNLQLSLFSGTGVNCATNQAPLLPTMDLPGNSVLVNRIAVAAGEYTPMGHSVCAQATGSGTITTIWYWTQF